MKQYVQEVLDVAKNYGLQILTLDFTDVTLLCRLEILPEIYIQIYRNLKKNKLNLALVFGKSRMLGFDSEGGQYHCHPIDQPEAHVSIERRTEIEEFVLLCFSTLQEQGLL